MNLSNFYILEEKATRGAVNLYPRDKIDYNQIFKNQIIPDFKLSYFVSSGKKFYDFLPTSTGYGLLISNRIVELFLEHNFNGWFAIPTEILKHEDYSYSFLSICGKSGPLDLNKFELIEKPLIPGMKKPLVVKKGMSFDINTWDGSSIFSPEGTLHTIITEEVKNVLEARKATNVSMYKLIDYERV